MRIVCSQGMSEEDVERFTADLLLAAIDTTSVTALWLLYVLASHEDVQVGPLESRHVGRYGLCDSPLAPLSFCLSRG